MDYVGGQTVMGNIYLNIISPVKANGIFLHMRGQEHTQFHERFTRQVPDGHDAQGNQKYRAEHYWEDHEEWRNVTKSRMQVYALGGQTLNQGQYTFPFQFVLPTGLPGVYHDRRTGEHGQFWLAETVYSLIAECDVTGFLSIDIKSEQRLVMYPALATEVKQVSETKTANVNFCCCINKGTANMTVHFNKNCYVPGEQAVIICEAKNDSTVDFTKIKVKLKSMVTMKCQSKTKNFEDRLHVSEFEGVKQMTDATGDKARRVDIMLARTDGKSGEPLQPETNGTNVKCKYWVEVEYDIPWCPDIEIKLPLTIYAPQPAPGWGVTVAPAYWAPDASNLPDGNVSLRGNVNLSGVL